MPVKTKTTTEKVTPSVTAPTRLYRSTTDRMLGGVCGGIAAHFNVDPTLVRLGFVLITIFGGAGILAYLILWLIIPSGPGEYDSRETIKRNAAEIKDRAEAITHDHQFMHSQAIWGLLFIVFGLVFLLQNFGLIINFDLFHYFWPLLLIAIGFSILGRRRE